VKPRHPGYYRPWVIYDSEQIDPMTPTTPRLGYRALDPSRSEIRLLNFKNVPDTAELDGEGVLRLTMHHASLDDESTEYLALSYVWGDANDTLSIIVDDVPFQATRNLASALRVMGTGNRDLSIWVDAVCINQLDTTERNLQVALMGRIYKQTKRLLAWLVPGDDKVKAIFAFIRVWSQFLNQWKTTAPPDADPMQLLPLFDYVTKGAFQERGMSLDGDAIDTFVEVFNTRVYWERCWIFQELYLLDDALLICASDIVVSMAEVFRVFIWAYHDAAKLVNQSKPESMDDTVWEFFRVLVTPMPSTTIFKVFAVKLKVADDSEHSERVTTLLHSTRFLKATDPRDKIYGKILSHLVGKSANTDLFP
jgi:hypothetical protein